MVKNLDDLEYMDVVLNGKETLEDVFADIKYLEVITKMQKVKKKENKIPPEVIMLIRRNETMQKLLFLLAS